VAEARLERVGSGLAPVTEGWFVVNVRDAAWLRSDTFGRRCVLEANGAVVRGNGRPPVTFPQMGFTVAVLEPGQPSTLYHAETAEENFLVVAGECVATFEGEQRLLRRWDFAHCPPGTLHAFRGAGAGTCILVAVGARPEDHRVRYEPTPLAESVAEPTTSPVEAYGAYGHWRNEGTPPGL
jgi:quercetin dioxygenase-like cupin family protein